MNLTRSAAWTRVLLACAAVAVLSGCGKLDAQFVVHETSGVNVTLFIGTQYGLSGGAQMCQQAATGLEGAKVSTEIRGSYSGCTISGRARFRDDSVSILDGARIVRDGADYRFQWQSSSLTTNASMLNEMRVSVTLPGEVTGSSGAAVVNKNTITWTNPADAMSSGGLNASSRVSWFAWTTTMLFLLPALGIGAGSAWYFRRTPKVRPSSHASAVQPDGLRAIAASPAVAPVTFCGHCGQARRATDGFCGGCGVAFREAAAVCACGQTNPVDALFCGRCGSPSQGSTTG